MQKSSISFITAQICVTIVMRAGGGGIYMNEYGVGKFIWYSHSDVILMGSSGSVPR